jgi:hypothetical protein
MRIVEARAPVRELIRKEIGMSVGEVSRRVSIDDAIADAAMPPVGDSLSSSRDVAECG